MVGVPYQRPRTTYRHPDNRVTDQVSCRLLSEIGTSSYGGRTWGKGVYGTRAWGKGARGTRAWGKGAHGVRAWVLPLVPTPSSLVATEGRVLGVEDVDSLSLTG